MVLYQSVSIRKLPNVILSKAKNLCVQKNEGILRRLAPQNDIPKDGFRMDITSPGLLVSFTLAV